MGRALGPYEGSEATVITQLTCSKAFAEFIEMQNFVDTSVFKGFGFKSYDNDDGPANGLANIGAGEMHGEVTGMTNRFGIKRKNIGDGAADSFTPEDEWNRKWVDGNLDQCMDQCKHLFTTVMHRAVSIALRGCPLHPEQRRTLGLT